jgi:hypothetical protein
MNKLIIMIPIMLLTITITQVHAKSQVIGGYSTGYAVGVQLANKDVDKFDSGAIKGINADHSPSCPVPTDKDYCHGIEDGYRDQVVNRLD